MKLYLEDKLSNESTLKLLLLEMLILSDFFLFGSTFCHYFIYEGEMEFEKLVFYPKLKNRLYVSRYTSSTV